MVHDLRAAVQKELQKRNLSTSLDGVDFAGIAQKVYEDGFDDTQKGVLSAKYKDHLTYAEVSEQFPTISDTEASRICRSFVKAITTEIGMLSIKQPYRQAEVIFRVMNDGGLEIQVNAEKLGHLEFLGCIEMLRNTTLNSVDTKYS